MELIKIVKFKPQSNYHTHCIFCDGHGSLEDYVKEAIKIGFKSLGFSSHAPLPFSNDCNMKKEDLINYINEITVLKEKYKNQIDIYCGLEVDYIENILGPDSLEFKNLNLDYTIGSVHFIKDKNTEYYLPVDNTLEEYEKIINIFFNGNIKDFICEYYRLIRKMLCEHKPDILGHLDLIRKHNNNHFNEEEFWYKEEISKTLNVIKNSGTLLEVNTGAIARGYLSTPYPSFWILKKCCDMDIPIVLNSDAHFPKNLNFYFEEALDLIKNAGYEYIYEMDKGHWIKKKIK